jgi:hypothetical protein
MVDDTYVPYKIRLPQNPRNPDLMGGWVLEPDF